MIVAHQDLEPRVDGVAIQVVRALPPKSLLGTLGEYHLESELRHGLSDLVGVDEASVTERDGHLPESILNELDMSGDLPLELIETPC